MDHRNLSHQQIEALAYHFWQERGCPWGTPETDWFRAEHELTEAASNLGLTGLAREIGGAIGSLMSLISSNREPS